jgi:hypothetical protein
MIRGPSQGKESQWSRSTSNRAGFINACEIKNGGEPHFVIHLNLLSRIEHLVGVLVSVARFTKTPQMPNK